MKTARQIERDAKVLWRLCLVGGSLDEERARVVVDQLIESRQTGALAVLKQFVRLVKLDRARRSARIESASQLDADVKAAVEAVVARRYGRTVTTTFAVDPTLIGGLRLTIGSDVYDGSIKAALAALDSGW
jgi:F-type H+-transporting ATPase subunit delta